MIVLKKNRFLYKVTAFAVSLSFASSMALSAGAWNENPGESETTTAATTTTPETSATIGLGNDPWDAEETTTTTEMPDAVLEDDIVAEEDDEDITPPADLEEEEIEEEITEAPDEEPEETVTEAPATTTAAATAAPSNTAAPDSYQAVDPFKMYVPEVLNVRGGPGTDYDKLGQVYANNTISIIGTSGDWYVFDYYGADGYLLSSLLTEVPAETQQTTTTEAAPETDTTVPPVEETDDIQQEGDVSIDDEPAETTVQTTEPVETEAPEETTAETTLAAAPVEGNDSTSGGMTSVILALVCAIAAFLLIGVVPVLVHKSHHKKLYQY